MATMFERFRLKRRQLPDRSSPQSEMKLPNFFIIGANKAGTSSVPLLPTTPGNFYEPEQGANVLHSKGTIANKRREGC